LAKKDLLFENEVAMGKPLTENQRRQLCNLMVSAFLEIRALGWAGHAAQAADLADAFHNLPIHLWRDDFNIEFFRNDLLAYDKKYAGNGQVTSYVKALDRIAATT
jgi:hypothetical protein